MAPGAVAASSAAHDRRDAIRAAPLRVRRTALASRAMEPQLTERDLALLLMNEESLLTFGAVLGLQARAGRGEFSPEKLPVQGHLPA